MENWERITSLETPQFYAHIGEFSVALAQLLASGGPMLVRPQKQ